MVVLREVHIKVVNLPVKPRNLYHFYRDVPLLAVRALAENDVLEPAQALVLSGEQLLLGALSDLLRRQVARVGGEHDLLNAFWPVNVRPLLSHGRRDVHLLHELVSHLRLRVKQLLEVLEFVNDAARGNLIRQLQHDVHESLKLSQVLRNHIFHEVVCHFDPAHHPVVLERDGLARDGTRARLVIVARLAGVRVLIFVKLLEVLRDTLELGRLVERHVYVFDDAPHVAIIVEVVDHLHIVIGKDVLYVI